MTMARGNRNFRFGRAFIVMTVMTAAAGWAIGPSSAQDLVSHPATGDSGGSDSGGFDLGNSTQPIDISADNGIEWNRDAKTYTARGNAVASQGDSEVHADTLIAYYTTDSNQIDRVVAEGNVKMMNPTQTAYGDHADYDRARALLVMTGHALKAQTPKETITARDQLEYWHDRDVMVARGDVVMVKTDGTTIKSDLATAYFRKNAQSGKREMFQVQADGNVRITTSKDYVTCHHAVYDPNTEISVLTGDVVLTQNGNVSRGGRAEIDSRTGVSRMFPAAGQRVHSIIQPKKNSNPGAPAPASANPSAANPRAAVSATPGGAMAFDPDAAPQ
jgi:lipopolysaccharide export system protein LptA